MLFSMMKFDPDGQVLCPKCDSNYIHHSLVQVFDRAEDAEYVDVITVDENQATTVVFRNDETQNPSYRRHGVLIHFWCENCGDDKETPHLKLAIAQHKGETYIGWK